MGPGSITTTSPLPTMYVPVPRYVNFEGLFAITRRMSGDTCSHEPYGTFSSAGTKGMGIA